MRCPKCGYISFDQEENCAKCNANLAEVSQTLAGTGVRVEESFFLSSILGQAEQQEDYEEVEFDLAEAEPDSDVQIEVAGDEEEIPVVDLSPFEQPEEAADEEESGISFSLPGEEAEEEAKEEEAVAEAMEEEEPGMQGSIDFNFGEEESAKAEPPPLEEAEGLDLSLDEAGGEEALEELDGDVPDLEEEAAAAAAESEVALPELELEMGSEETEETLDFAAGDQAETADETAAAKGAGLDLDIDVNLEEDEPPEEDMVFNLEDIDMSDLVIDESGGAAEDAGRPEDTAVDLEDFLSGGKGNESDAAPMDLTMEDVDLGDKEQDKNKKSGDQVDLEL